MKAHIRKKFLRISELTDYIVLSEMICVWFRDIFQQTTWFGSQAVKEMRSFILKGQQPSKDFIAEAFEVEELDKFSYR